MACSRPSRPPPAGRGLDARRGSERRGPGLRRGRPHARRARPCRHGRSPDPGPGCPASGGRGRALRSARRSSSSPVASSDSGPGTSSGRRGAGPPPFATRRHYPPPGGIRKGPRRKAAGPREIERYLIEMIVPMELPKSHGGGKPDATNVFGQAIT